MEFLMPVVLGIAIFLAAAPIAQAGPASARCVQLFRDVDAHDRKLALLNDESLSGSPANQIINAQSIANEIAAKSVTIQTMAGIKCPLPDILPSGDAPGPYSAIAFECLIAKGQRGVDDYMVAHGDQRKPVDLSSCRLQDWVGNPPVVYPPQH